MAKAKSIPAKRPNKGRNPQAKRKKAAALADKNTINTSDSSIGSSSLQQPVPQEQVAKVTPISRLLTSRKKSFASIARTVLIGQKSAARFRSREASSWAPSKATKHQYWKAFGGLHLEAKKLSLNGVLKQLKRDERSKFYRQFFVYIVFLISLFNFVLWIPISESYQQSDVVSKMLCKGNDTPCRVQNLTDIYGFAHHIAESVCGWKEDSRMNQWHRLGDVVLRQVKSRKTPCMLGSKAYTCHPEYSSEFEEQDVFVGKKTNTTYQWKANLQPLTSRGFAPLFSFIPFIYWNEVNHFGTGGYQTNLCDPNALKNLRADDWIDLDTRAVSLDFQLINPTTTLFTVGHHLLRINSFGNIKQTSLGGSFRLFTPGRDPGDNSMAFWAVVVSVFVCSYMFKFMRSIREHGLKVHCSKTWEIISLIQYITLFYLLYNLMLFHIESKKISDIALHKNLYTENAGRMQNTLLLYISILDSASLSVAFSLLKVFKFIRISSTLNFFWHVLSLASRDILGFLVISAFIVIAYAVIGFLGFGNSLVEFSSPRAAFTTCLEILFTRYDFNRLQEANPRLYPVFMSAYLITMVVMVSHIIVAVLTEYWKAARAFSQNSDVEYDIIQRSLNRFRALTPNVIVNDGEIIELSPGQTVNLISSSILDAEIKRTNARKRFRCAVWRILALLRFGVNFDNFLKVGLVHTWITSEHITKVRDIRLSSNFDHKTIKKMLPVGATIHVKRDGVTTVGVVFKVVRHCNMYTECTVMNEMGPIDLKGNERLQIPWFIFFVYLIRSCFEYSLTILGSVVYTHPPRPLLISDTVIAEIMEEGLDEKHSSLRYDEIYRRVEIRFRRDKTHMFISNDEIGKQTALIMLRFQNAMFDMPSREKEGHDYIPNPHDTSAINLNLDALVELLAKNCHDYWAKARLENGWKCGRRRDDAKKEHPNLVPYDALSPQEKDYDRRTAVETLKTIYILHFHILYKGKPIDTHPWDPLTCEYLQRSKKLVAPSTVYHGDKVYTPTPIDASDVILPSRLLSLAHLLAENTHEVWSVGRMNDGWVYGPKRDDRRRHHPCLVPYVFLTDEEKEYDFNTALGTLKTLMAVGFTIRG